MLGAMLLGVALASPDVMVSLDYPVARTAAFKVFTQPTTAGSWATERRPQRYHLYGGLAAQVAVRDVGRAGHVVIDGGARGIGAQWSLENGDWSAWEWEFRTNLAFRQGLTQRGGPVNLPLARGHVIGGAGAQVTAFGAPWWPVHLNPAVNGFAGLGLSVGSQRVRVVTEVRVSTTLRIDRYQGSAQMADSKLTWKYWPGSAQVGLSFGLHLPARERVDAGGEAAPG